MAVLAGATASGKQFYSGSPGTSLATLYTAPAASSNVTSPSATSYIKEIILCNITGSAATVTLTVNGQSVINGLSVGANDTKILTGLNTMMPAGSTIGGLQGTASAVTVTISGVEVQ